MTTSPVQIQIVTMFLSKIVDCYKHVFIIQFPMVIVNIFRKKIINKNDIRFYIYYISNNLLSIHNIT